MVEEGSTVPKGWAEGEEITMIGNMTGITSHMKESARVDFPLCQFKKDHP